MEKKNLITIIDTQGTAGENRLHVNYLDKVFYVGQPAKDDDIYVNFHEKPAVDVLSDPEVAQTKASLLANGFKEKNKSDYQASIQDNFDTEKYLIATKNKFNVDVQSIRSKGKDGTLTQNQVRKELKNLQVAYKNVLGYLPSVDIEGIVRQAEAYDGKTKDTKK